MNRCLLLRGLKLSLDFNELLTDLNRVLLRWLGRLGGGRLYPAFPPRR